MVLTAAVGALVWGAACWAPVAPAPLNPATTPTAVPPRAVAPTVRTTPTATATAVPTVAPTLVPLPTVTPGGQALLASVRSDMAAQWVKNTSETALRAGPSDDAAAFTVLPQWTILRQTDARPDWLAVYYSGDGETRQPGPGWVRAADVGAIGTPSVWLKTAQTTPLLAGADPGATRRLDLPADASMEVLGLGPDSGTRLWVRLPGDGRQVPPAEGWVDASALAREATPGAGDVPWSYPAVLKADVRMPVPYRGQFDGSAYAAANCGPTVLGMVLEAFGHNLEPPVLRNEVLDAEQFPRWDNDAGSYIWALARVAEANGIHTSGLYDNASDQTLHRWSIDDVRRSVLQGDPVVVQVLYRALPKRQGSAYTGDHYIVITGLLGDNFLYNDPIGGPIEGPGWDRMITPTQLQRAMQASDTPFAHTAFAVSKS